MAELYPHFDLPPDLLEGVGQAQKPTYAPSCSFDFQLGDFATDGTGAMASCDGVEAWKQWCIKTIATTRFACLAYSGEIGMERQRLESLSTYEAVCLELEREITEALLADPAGRTYAVQDFSFSRKQDGIFVTCRVLGKEQQQIEIAIEI